MTQKQKTIMSNEKENVKDAKKSSSLSKRELNDLLEQGLAILQVSGCYVPQYRILDNGSVFFHNDMPSAELQRFINLLNNDEGY
jgi:hypothetical protein